MTPTPYRVLSLIPPMTQLNTPYPSTAYLTGFLRSRGLEPHPATAAEFASVFAADVRKWGEVIRRAKIELQ